MSSIALTLVSLSKNIFLCGRRVFFDKSDTHHIMSVIFSHKITGRYCVEMTLAVLLACSVTGCGESAAGKANQKAINSDGGDIAIKLARASEAAGDFPAAERLYKQAAAKDGGIPPRLELAQFYRRHHGERQALAVFRAAQKIDPRNTEVMRGIANVEIDTGQPAEALKTLDKALAIDASDALLYNSKGVALDMLGKTTQARNAYSTAVTLDPDDKAVFDANLGMSYILTGSYSKTIRLLAPLADAPDSTPAVRQNLALAYGLKGDNAGALKYAMRDMPKKEAEENVRFYNMLAKKGGVKKPADAVKPVDTVTNIPPIP
jgi:Flp pilus assembly protein TadD